MPSLSSPGASWSVQKPHALVQIGTEATGRKLLWQWVTGQSLLLCLTVIEQ
jgi:hypothetical protein